MTGNISYPYKGKIVKRTVIEDVEYDIYELPYSDFSKAAAILFDKRLLKTIPISLHLYFLDQ